MDAPPTSFQDITAFILGPSIIVWFESINLEQKEMVNKGVKIDAIFPIDSPLDAPGNLS